MKRDRLFEIYDDLKDATAVTVKIHHDQVLQVVTNDLVAKYKMAHTEKHKQQMKAVLLGWYLTEEEFLQLTQEK